MIEEGRGGELWYTVFILYDLYTMSKSLKTAIPERPLRGNHS